MELEPARLFKALVELARSPAACTNPDSVLAELYRILQTVVEFDRLALLLNEETPGSVRSLPL